MKCLINSVKNSSSKNKKKSLPTYLPYFCSARYANITIFFFWPYLGCSNLTRKDAKSHKTVFSSTFFGTDKVMSIWDGTHFYTEKCRDHEMARRTYSGHKHRPLVKFMSVVLLDGYVLDTLGPYFSDRRNNDANMTRHILRGPPFSLE